MIFENLGTPIGDMDIIDLDYTGAVLNIQTLEKSYNDITANYVRIQVVKDGTYDSFTSDQAIARFTVDDNDPSPTSGFVLGDNDIFEFQVGELKNNVQFCVNDTDITASCKLIVQGYRK